MAKVEVAKAVEGTVGAEGEAITVVATGGTPVAVEEIKEAVRAETMEKEVAVVGTVAVAV